MTELRKLGSNDRHIKWRVFDWRKGAMNRISLMTSVQSRRKLDLVSLFSKTNRFCMDCKDERCGGYLAKRTDFPAAVAPSEVKEHSTEDGPIDHDSEVTDSFTCVIRLEKKRLIFSSCYSRPSPRTPAALIQIRCDLFAGNFTWCTA